MMKINQNEYHHMDYKDKALLRSIEISHLKK
jgi:hypothetical protein